MLCYDIRFGKTLRKESACNSKQCAFLVAQVSKSTFCYIHVDVAIVSTEVITIILTHLIGTAAVSGARCYGR